MATRIACDSFAALHCVLEAFKVRTRWLFRRAACDLKPPGNAVFDGDSASCRIRKVHASENLRGGGSSLLHCSSAINTVRSNSASLKVLHWICSQQVDLISPGKNAHSLLVIKVLPCRVNNTPTKKIIAIGLSRSCNS